MTNWHNFNSFAHELKDFGVASHHGVLLVASTFSRNHHTHKELLEGALPKSWEPVTLPAPPALLLRLYRRRLRPRHRSPVGPGRGSGRDPACLGPRAVRPSRKAREALGGRSDPGERGTSGRRGLGSPLHRFPGGRPAATTAAG